jgi:protein-S-isoprenylcysteine O-methyltransferase
MSEQSSSPSGTQLNVNEPFEMAHIQSPRERRSATSSSSESEEQEATTFSLEDLGSEGVLSQTSISLEAYILGIILGVGFTTSFYLLFIQSSRLWRPPFFLCLLSAFHFCEFYTYARWNLKNLTANSYLTLSNGRPYIYAMTFAFLETSVTSAFFPNWQSRWAQPWLQAIGLIAVVTGQVIRDLAIATAGTSFNHHVQKKKRSDHILVTWGPYTWFRHPSYFGFYWWAVGTQLLLGNAISTPIFTLVVWNFFYRRIPSELAKYSMSDLQLILCPF